MTELESEILFLRQAIVARRVLATLPAQAAARPNWQAPLAPTPEGNGKRGTLREVGIASCPLAPDSRTTTRGKRSQEGIARRQIARNEAEIAKLKAKLKIN